jgi:hypothetical protein
MRAVFIVFINRKLYDEQRLSKKIYLAFTVWLFTPSLAAYKLSGNGRKGWPYLSIYFRFRPNNNPCGNNYQQKISPYILPFFIPRFQPRFVWANMLTVTFFN